MVDRRARAMSEQRNYYQVRLRKVERLSRTALTWAIIALARWGNGLAQRKVVNFEHTL